MRKDTGCHRLLGHASRSSWPSPCSAWSTGSATATTPGSTGPRSQLYSLSDKTLNILKGVTRPGARHRVHDRRRRPLFTETKELLTRYEAASAKLTVEYIDPERDPLRTQQLAQDFGVSAANTVVFIVGDRKKYVTSDQLAEYDYSGYADGPAAEDEGVQGRGAVHRRPSWASSTRRQPKIYFTTGHGEHDPDGAAAGRAVAVQGVPQARQPGGREGRRCSPATVPETATCSWSPGPRRRSPRPESRPPSRPTSTRAGARSCCSTPCSATSSGRSGLEALLKEYGVAVRRRPRRRPRTTRCRSSTCRPSTSTTSARHPVVDGHDGAGGDAAGGPLGLHRDGRGRHVDAPCSPPRPRAGARRDLAAIAERQPIAKDATDTQGPVSLGVAAQSETDKDNGVASGGVRQLDIRHQRAARQRRQPQPRP